jgi:hypothetical protein
MGMSGAVTCRTARLHRTRPVPGALPPPAPVQGAAGRGGRQALPVAGVLQVRLDAHLPRPLKVSLDSTLGERLHVVVNLAAEIPGAVGAAASVTPPPSRAARASSRDTSGAAWSAVSPSVASSYRRSSVSLIASGGVATARSPSRPPLRSRECRWLSSSTLLTAAVALVSSSSSSPSSLKPGSEDTLTPRSFRPALDQLAGGSNVAVTGRGQVCSSLEVGDIGDREAAIAQSVPPATGG